MQNENIKLFDFGLARQLPRDDSDTETYRLTEMTGALRYMAPEVALGRRYNQSCDVYSMAIVLWEMLACAAPFAHKQLFEKQPTGRGELTVLLGPKQQKQRPRLHRSWPRDVQNLLAKAWHAQARQRPTANQLQTILGNVVEDLRQASGDGDFQHRHRRLFSSFQNK